MPDETQRDGETGEKPIIARLNPSTNIDILCRHGGGYRIQASLVIETKEEAGAASEVLSILGYLLDRSMGDNQGDDTAARRLNAIRSYRFKASENVLTEETVFLLGQIDARDAEIERLCLAIGGMRLRIEDQGKEIERLRVRNAALEAIAEAAHEWKAARTTLSAEHPRTYQTNRRVTVAQEALDKAIDHDQPEPRTGEP